MKAAELRIGNLIAEPHDNITEVVTEIVSHTKSDGSGEINREPESYFNPIPLTEEWLLKFGFEDSEIALKLGCSLQIRLNTGHAALWSSDGCTESHNIITDCKYVHQLQNLYFALTGEELEVKP